MRIKNIFNIIMLISLVGFMFSCTDLEETLLDEQLGAELVNDPNNVQSLINPPYASLRRTIEWSNYWGLQEVTTDEVIIPTKGKDWYDNGIWQQMHLHQWNADNFRLENVWNFLTQGISRANTAIHYIGKFEQSETNELYIYEARFLKAYYMYLIADLYGQVPFREAEDLNFTEDPIVYDRTQAVEYIISELEEILPHLKTKSEVGSTRATVGAANTLLAKVYMNHEVFTGTAKWAEAISYCDKVIASNDYAIADDYWSMFLYDVEEHPEFILRVPMDDNVDYGADVQWTNPALHYAMVFGNFTSLWNGPALTSTFFETWGTGENDARYYDDRQKDILGFNFGLVQGQQYSIDGTPLKQGNGEPLIFVPEVDLKSSPENAGIRVVKYTPNPNTVNQFRTGNDIPIMRISDIYLLRAEAKFRNGDEAGALTDVNAIRAKRSAEGKTLPALTTVTLNDILDERGFELYWEGLRRQDLIRHGKYDDAWQEKPATDVKKALFAIPTSALDVNKNLIQNDSY